MTTFEAAGPAEPNPNPTVSGAEESGAETTADTVSPQLEPTTEALARQARQAVEVLWSCYGANAIYTRDPLQRYLRDLLAINQHFSFNFDIAGAAFGLDALGGSYVNPAL